MPLLDGWLLEVEELECIDVVDVHCVDKRLMEVENVECMGILDVHFVAEGLAQARDGDCVDVEKGDRMHILNPDVQC